MSNAIAELFVNLGITGTDNVAKGLKSVDSGMGDVASSGLAAKAAILAVVYGLEQMMSSSAQAGTNIQNLTALTGVSGKFFQQMGNAAKVAGASSQDATQMVVGLYKGMGKLMANEGIPAAYNVLHLRYTKDAQNMAQQLIAVAQANKESKNPLVNKLLNDIGMTDQMQELAMRGKFDPKKLASMDFYSDRTTKSLDAVTESMGRLHLGWDMFFGRLTSEHGGSAVASIQKLSTALMDLGVSMDSLGNKSGAFERMKDAATGVSNTLKLAKELLDRIQGKESGGMLPKGSQELFPGFSGSPVGKFLSGSVAPAADFSGQYFKDLLGPLIPDQGINQAIGEYFANLMPSVNIENLNVTSDHDPKAIAHAVKAEVGGLLVTAKSKIPLQGKPGGGH